MAAVLKAKRNVSFYNSISGKQSLLQNVCDAIAETAVMSQKHPKNATLDHGICQGIQLLVSMRYNTVTKLNISIHLIYRKNIFMGVVLPSKRLNHLVTVQEICVF